ncbi:MAG: hypothetical protein LAP61_13965 [Acidobacteriia bacterium]|nr:hypothetical protein [Terriglobia bacterium]
MSSSSEEANDAVIANAATDCKSADKSGCAIFFTGSTKFGTGAAAVVIPSARTTAARLSLPSMDDFLSGVPVLKRNHKKRINSKQVLSWANETVRGWDRPH